MEQMDVSNDSFDLSRYIEPYQGELKIRRLLHIANVAPDLSVQAYRLAIDNLKTSLNTKFYTDVANKAREVLGDRLGEGYEVDAALVAKNNRQSLDRLNKLEHTWNAVKREGERDPMKNALMDLAEYYIDCGDYMNALSRLNEAREHANSNRDIAFQSMKCHLFSGSMPTMKSYASRVLAAPEITELMTAQANALIGLHAMTTSHFRTATQSFLSTSFEINGRFNEAITGRDICLYGTLCALASLNRKELKAQVLGSVLWKKYLELMPICRTLLQEFCRNNFRTCFKILDSLKRVMYCDTFLHNPSSRLLNEIKQKALSQFFKPYTSVHLKDMATAFGLSENDLERHLVELIADNKLSARIDSHQRVLYARHANERITTYQQALNTGDHYIRDARCLLMRLALIQNEMQLKQGKRDDDFDMPGGRY